MKISVILNLEISIFILTSFLAHRWPYQHMVTTNHENNVRNVFCIPKNHGKQLLHTYVCQNVKRGVANYANKKYYPRCSF